MRPVIPLGDGTFCVLVFLKNYSIEDKLVAIDCGCVSGGPLGCLCLDTLEEIYV